MPHFSAHKFYLPSLRIGVNFVSFSIPCFQKPFDAEELSECKLHIRGISSDGEGQTQLIVKIINENDHAPTFSRVLHVGHVKEGLPEDSAVIGGDGKALIIHATDDDVSNSDLMYEVVGCSAFTVDSQTGALLTTEVKSIKKTKEPKKLRTP